MQGKRGSERSAHGPGSAGVPRRGRTVAAALLIPMLVLFQGCFSYRAAELPSIAPGEPVRLTLDGNEFSRVAPGALTESPRRIEGNLLRITEDTVAVSVWIGEAYRGTPFEAAHQEISIARSGVVRVEQRQLSRGRTAAVAAATVAIIVALIDGIGLVEMIDGDDRDGGGPPVPPQVAPLPR